MLFFVRVCEKKKSQSGHTVCGVFSPNLSVPACLYVCLRLSLTNTLVVLHLVAWRTDTSEGPIQILTSSWRASAGQTHTLVDVCGEWDNYLMFEWVGSRGVSNNLLNIHVFVAQRKK